MPASLDGRDLGTPAQLPAFNTGDALTPPRLSVGLAINPVVGPDRFSVFNISQDKPGFAYLMVTQPHNQVNDQVGFCCCGALTKHIAVLCSPGGTFCNLPMAKSVMLSCVGSHGLQGLRFGVHNGVE